MKTNLITTFNPEAPAIKFHQVQVGEYFRSKVILVKHQGSSFYNVPRWTVYKKLNGSTAEIIATPNNGNRNDGKGYTEKFSPATVVYMQ